MNEQKLEIARSWLISADSLLITAGAGMGVDSGLPDFRGNEGLWRAYPALRASNLSFSEIANPAWFYKHPRLAWGFYGHRLQMYRQVTPHDGFSILRRWVKKFAIPSTVFTSNVDGQFQRAGFNLNAVYECHGSIHFLQCSRPCTEDIWPADEFIPLIDPDQCLLLNEIPTCPRCGEVARPNILMFNDGGWLPNRSDAQEAHLQTWLQGVSAPLIVEIGAGTAIASVRDFGADVCRQWDAKLLRINLRESGVENNHSIGLSLGALKALKNLDALIEADFS